MTRSLRPIDVSDPMRGRFHVPIVPMEAPPKLTTVALADSVRLSRLRPSHFSPAYRASRPVAVSLQEVGWKTGSHYLAIFPQCVKIRRIPQCVTLPVRFVH